MAVMTIHFDTSVHSLPFLPLLPPPPSLLPPSHSLPLPPPSQWLVAASVLEVLHKLLVGYQVRGEDFVVSSSAPSNPPGFTLLLHLMKDSKLLRKVGVGRVVWCVGVCGC